MARADRGHGRKRDLPHDRFEGHGGRVIRKRKVADENVASSRLMVFSSFGTWLRVVPHLAARK